MDTLIQYAQSLILIKISVNNNISCPFHTVLYIQLISLIFLTPYIVGAIIKDDIPKGLICLRLKKDFFT